MLIVFEGPDGAGKTTLLNLTREILSACGRDVTVFRHLRRPAVVTSPDWPDAAIAHANYNALTHMCFECRDLLVDRLWVTDAVYGDVLRRTPYDRSYIRPARDFDAVAVVYVTATEAVLRERRRCHEPMHDFIGKFAVAFEAYFRHLPSSEAACPVVAVRSDGAFAPHALARSVVWDLLSVDAERRGLSQKDILRWVDGMFRGATVS